MIGAVLAEQAGSSDGLGHLLLQAIPQLETPRAYAAVVLLSALALRCSARSRWPSAWRAVGATNETEERARKPPAVPAARCWRGARRRGCGEKKERPWARRASRSSTVVLDYLPNPDHVGFYAARVVGDFKRAGLNVDLRCHPTRPRRSSCWPPGKADLAISYEPRCCSRATRGCAWSRWGRSPSAR